MRPAQFVVPALPILLPLGLVLMGVSAAALWQRGLLTARRLAGAWLCGWYAVAVLGATLLPLHISWDAGPPGLFRINPIPLLMFRPSDFVLNIAMMLPLAAAHYIIFGVRDQTRVIKIGFLISAIIEVTQAVLILTVHDNRWAETNDLISNVLGAYLGFLAFRRLMRFAAIRRLVDSAALHPAPGLEPAAG
jgi:glycopeptide antibiotics resistance protein